MHLPHPSIHTHCTKLHTSSKTSLMTWTTCILHTHMHALLPRTHCMHKHTKISLTGTLRIHTYTSYSYVGILNPHARTCACTHTQTQTQTHTHTYTHTHTEHKDIPDLEYGDSHLYPNRTWILELHSLSRRIRKLIRCKAEIDTPPSLVMYFVIHTSKDYE